MAAFIYWFGGAVLGSIVAVFVVASAIMAYTGGWWLIGAVASAAIALWLASMLWRFIVKPARGGNAPTLTSGD